LSMTIPLSLIGQIVLNDQKASPLYWVGAVAVVLSFVFVSEEEKQDDGEAISPVLDDEERLAEHGGASRS
jgi:solute carrier family 35 protein F5